MSRGCVPFKLLMRAQASGMHGRLAGHASCLAADNFFEQRPAHNAHSDKGVSLCTCLAEIKLFGHPEPVFVFWSTCKS